MEIELKTAPAQQSGSRSALYRLLARGFAFPSQEFYEDVKGGRLLSQVREAVRGLPYTLEAGGQLGDGLSLSYDDFQSTYIAQFELGGPEGAAVPLYEGHYGGGLLRDMEEVLRLYHHFGFRYTGGFRPDHLQTELEFLHGLTFGEAAALDGQGEPGLYRQAEREFLQYHLKGLASRVAEGLRGRQVPLYPELAQLISAFAARELEYLAV